jgi:hypothetical protein
MSRFSLDVLNYEKAPALALLYVVIKKYGVEAFSWQPEFLREELESDFNVCLSDLQSDKLQAAIIILQTDLFEGQWEVFKTICHLLNNTPDNFEDATGLEAEEVASALAQYKLLVGSTGTPPFSDEVNAGAGVVFYNYGMSEAPSILPTASIPGYAVKADPTEKNQALSEIYDSCTKSIIEYAQSIVKE